MIPRQPRVGAADTFGSDDSKTAKSWCSRHVWFSIFQDNQELVQQTRVVQMIPRQPIAGLFDLNHDLNRSKKKNH